MEEEQQNENLNESMNNILKAKIQEARTEKIQDTVQRVVGNYKRVYFFEDFIKDISIQNINAIKSLISNNDRQNFYSTVKEFTTQLSFYKFFDIEWQKLYNEYIKKDKSLNKSIEENLVLINSTYIN